MPSAKSETAHRPAPWPYNSHTVHSLDDAAHSMSGWQIDMLQMSPGKLNYSLSMTQLGHIQIFRELADKPLLKRGMACPGSLVFSFVLKAQGRGWLSGRAVDPQVGLVVDGDLLPEIITPDHLDLIFIVVDRRWLSDRIGDSANEQISTGVRSFGNLSLWHEQELAVNKLLPTSMRASQAAGPGMGMGMAQVLQQVEVGEEDTSGVEELVLEALLEVLNSVRRIEPVSETGHKHLIDQARTLMLGNSLERQTMSQVAAQLGVSRRHLQTCFNSAVGIPATEFVRAERLNQVRRELVRARRSARSVSIGDVAAEWGFWHLSRFASDYRDMFGELPSETLRPHLPSSPRRATIEVPSAFTSQNG
ncbi:helix-turn-helix domain-containing protein [Herbaspirillum rubrisubalbicans]|uniref:helix-turn-helix domain-containing protein n=1 Tax=Herbaspirillum rubrisubalbicans TaxID=80842 RepID=UPI0003765BD2|nr:helix-turn-helix domain-containing protein [Herbaspirillum rubrisubalbicans]